jgi:hypothetical protein
MFDSGILDTVIGLTFVFLLVSMLVTIMNEMVASFFKSRAKWLRWGIERLVGSDWMKQVYAHPLIEGAAGKDEGVAAGRDGPSYIPSRSFANVLMSVIQQNSAGLKECQRALRSALDSASAAGANVETLKAQLSAAAGKLQGEGGLKAAAAGDLIRRLEAAGAPDTRKWLGQLDARIKELEQAARPEFDALLRTLAKLVADGVRAEAGIDDLRKRFDDAVENLLTGPATLALKDELTAMGKRLRGPYTVADAHADIQWFIEGMSARYVRQMLEELPEGRIRQLLLTLFEDAKNDVEQFKQNIEVWFNNGMDRVNGWYKRHSQRVIVVLALGTVVAMNVDAILIFRYLQTNPGVRDAIVAQATLFAQKNPPTAPGTSPTIYNGSDFSGNLTLKQAGEKRIIQIESDNPAVKLLTPAVEVAKGDTEVPFTVDTAISDKPGAATIRSKDGSTDEVKLTLAPSLPGQFHTVQDNLAALTLPIGWVRKGTPAEMKNGQVIPTLARDYGNLLRQHGFGWLLTALAATLGAPFWFDMLNRIISIRAAGKPPEEQPKPPKTVSVPVEPGQSQQEADRIRQSELHRK